MEIQKLAGLTPSITQRERLQFNQQETIIHKLFSGVLLFLIDLLFLTILVISIVFVKDLVYPVIKAASSGDSISQVFLTVLQSLSI